MTFSPINKLVIFTNVLPNVKHSKLIFLFKKIENTLRYLMKVRFDVAHGIIGLIKEAGEV